MADRRTDASKRATQPIVTQFTIYYYYDMPTVAIANSLTLDKIYNCIYKPLKTAHLGIGSPKQQQFA